MKKTIILLALIFLIGLTSQISTGKLSIGKELKAKNNLKVGANLKEYKKPTKKECDINVPSQYATIQAAVDAAVDGNTVCVKAGIYNEDVLINKSIKLSGNGFEKSSNINGQGSRATVEIDAFDVILEGFVINGVGPDYTNQALLIWVARDAIIRYNHIIAGNGGLTLLARNQQNGHIIAHNILEGNNSPQIAVIHMQSDDISFLNNTFIGTVNPTSRQDTGIVLSTGATNNLIKNNLFNVAGTIVELIQCAYSSNVINENNFNSDTKIKVRAGYDGTTNAENNWWGDNDPSDNIQGDVDFTPFATKPFKEN